MYFNTKSCKIFERPIWMIHFISRDGRNTPTNVVTKLSCSMRTLVDQCKLTIAIASKVVLLTQQVPNSSTY